jgi:hypothetical protein
MPATNKTQLIIPANLRLPSAAAEYLDSVSLEVSPDDVMYQGNDAHYLSAGASALNVILAVLTVADAPVPKNVLDFGADAGRVTRWLRAAFPGAEVHTCDLHDADMRFNERAFGARTWTTGTDIGVLASPPSSYDLIWIGSVATHLSAQNSERLLDKMLTWTNPGGIVAMSLHGRFVSKSYKRQCEMMGFPYIYEQAWTTITALYEETGYGYADYEGQDGYGISLTKLSWAAALVERREGIRLVTLAEKVWDNHHDVLAVQKVHL